MSFKGLGGSEKSRKLTSVDNIDWCAAMANTQTVKSPFVRNLIQESRSMMPDFFRKCPLLGVMSMINFKMSQKLLIMLPIGTYIMRTLMCDEIKSGKTKLEMTINFSIVDD